MLKLLTENKKTLSFTALVLVLVLLLPENALADNNALNSPLQSVLFGIVTSVFGRLVWLGGVMLDYSIAIFVVGFGQQYATTGLGFAIDSLWSVVRDIFNLTFIFGLVYIGFKMIFDSSDSNAKKMLGSLVMAALLVNFSLFITKFVIDFSNIAASQFAAAFYNSGNGTYEVAASFMNLLGLSTLWQQGTMVSDGAGYGYIFGTLILFLVAAFVFGAGAILLTIRFVVLNIYMVLSPLMFLGWVFPGFSGTSKDYWKGFLSRAFFAPAYILMIYFSNQILVNLRGNGAGGNMANVFGAPTVSQTTFSSVMPYFILTCVFLISSLVVAQKMGAQGATSAVALGKRASSGTRGYIQKKAGNATVGTAAWVGRNTIGAAGNNATSNGNKFGRSINAAAQGKGVKAWAARRVQDVSSAAATASYDVRNVGNLGKEMGIGEGHKGGFAKMVEERSKKEKDRAKKFAYNDQVYADYGVQEEFDTYNDLITRRNKMFEELAQTDDQNERTRLSDISRGLQEEISHMEDAKLSDVEKSRLSEPEQKAKLERLSEFKAARKAAKANYGQRLYAANLKTRYDNLPLVGGTWFTESQERDSAAEEINKQAGANPTEKLLKDLFKDENPKPDDAPKP